MKYKNCFREIENSEFSFICRILQYFKNSRQDIVIDPTPEKKWLRSKAQKMSLVISQDPELIITDDPLLLIGNYGSDQIGWCQSLENLPAITVNGIEAFFDKSTKAVMRKGTKIKKHFRRGEQFVKENYIDSDYVYTKYNEKYFFVKGICVASMKSKERWVSLAVNRSNGDISYAFCECPSGNGGQCSHCYALMKITAQWSLDGLTEIPSLACTSKPCQWSVKKSSGRTEKPTSINLTLQSSRAKSEVPGKRPRATGTSCSMYESRTKTMQAFDSEDVKKFVSELKAENPLIPGVSVMQTDCMYGSVSTRFGLMPVGSPVAIHYAHLPHGFNVYCSPVLANCSLETNPPIFEYPLLPLNLVENHIQTMVQKISDAKQILFLESLKVTKEKANEIESSTTEQRRSEIWFKERKFRFTASKCHDLRKLKTSRAFPNLAAKFINGNKQDTLRHSFVQRKLEHGVFYEPFAISVYESYMKLNERPVTIFSNGLWISPDNYVYAATPDGKVADPQETNVFGILEVKCPEEYKDFDPKDAAVVVKDFCLTVNNQGIKINQEHSYFDQIQFQMGLTGAPWCDFIVYTLKGMVIDRVYFDRDHFVTLVSRVNEFYFNHFLPLASGN